MQQKINTLAVFATVMTCLVLVTGGVLLFGSDNEVVPEGYVSPTEFNVAVSSAVSNAILEKDSLISDLTTQLAERTAEAVEGALEVVERVAEETKEALGYVIDSVFLNSVTAEAFTDREVLTLTDREVSTLFDGEVEFDGTDYDAEEVVELSNMNVQANEDDFEGTAYLVIPKKSIEYTMVFENSLDTSEITNEETLTFNLLGEEVEVSSWDGNSVTFSRGEEYYLTNGDNVVVDNKTFVLTNVLEESIYVTVDGVSKKINEGDTRTVNGLEVQVKDVIYSTIGPVLQASVVIGEDVTKTIVDGDEYAEDSIWKYVVKANYIGIVLNEEFNELDDELTPLAETETLCLPNEYVCVRYDGFVESDFEELSLNLEDGFVEIDGNFQVGLNDYDRLLVNSTGVYNEDEEEVTGTILIGSSDVEMVVGTGITIEDFEVNFDLNVTSVDSEEYSVRTDFGILVENPEDSIEDQSWIISVPEEMLESTITVL